MGNDAWDDIELELEGDDVVVSTSTSVEMDDESDDKGSSGHQEGRAAKRIKALVRKTHEERERADALLREVENLKKQVGFLGKNQREFENATVAGLKRDLEKEIEAADQAWVEAVNEGDSAKAVELRKRSRELESKLNKVNSYEPAADEDQGQEQTRGIPPNQKVVAWLNKHPEVTGDPVLRAATAEKARELEADGWSPHDDDYYEEVEKHLASEFPNRFRVGETRRSSPPRSVGGKTRAAGGKRTVTLTKDEQAMAKKFGMSVQDYAKHKVQAERATEENGGYVNIFE